ncbi:MAG: peptide chain release factor N(5)-glutamine methyltransferase [Chloroflexota bacterium]|nr:peptide chain release factor N(5)-glutamine methyltransferase [Chloroflexota bacterium]
MTSCESLYLAGRQLAAANIDCATVEAELLLCHVLGTSKTKIYGEPERVLTSIEIGHLQHLIQRRLLHEPAAHILGCSEFYGREFYIDHRALIPRPETELIVEEAIKLVQKRSLSENHLAIADIGTGSGVIAISLALEFPFARIYATDISNPALQVAEINCRRHKVSRQVKLLQGDLLEALPEPVNMLVANLPYVRDRELRILSQEIAKFEPLLALAGGNDGLDEIRRLLDQLPGRISNGGCLILEIGQGQDRTVKSIIRAYFPQASIELIPDLGGTNRVVKATLEV